MDDLETGHVRIKVINSGGTLVRVLYEGSWEPDQHVYWNGVDQDGKKAPKGDYFIVVQTATKTISRKVSIR
jgi:flagellar hook assembly protein FlgD